MPFSRSRLRASAFAGLLIASLVLPASAAELKGFEVLDTSVDRGFGTTSGLALTLNIEGLGSLTVGQAGGYVAWDRETQSFLAPVVPDAMLRPCSTAGAIRVGGTDSCIDRTKLAAAGVNVSGNSVSEATLFAAGVTKRNTVDQTRKFTVPLGDASALLKPRENFLDSQLGVNPSEATTPANPQGLGQSAALVIPGVAESKAVCDARSGEGNVSNKSTGLNIPAPLAPVVTGQIATSTCELVRGGDSKALPTLKQGWGEVHLDVTASQTVVSSLPQVSDLMTTLAGSVPEPVKSTIEALRDQINAAPLVDINIAKGDQTVSATDSGVISNSVAGDVEIDVLGGIAQIFVSKASSSASVTAAGPEATAQCALATVRVLNLTTPAPDDVIEQTIGCPNQKLTLLENVAGIGNAARVFVQTGVVDNSKSCTDGLCRASSGATVLTLELLGAPLPKVTLQIASTDTYAQVKSETKSSAVTLPVTGPGTAGTVVIGLGIAAVAILTRRRFA